MKSETIAPQFELEQLAPAGRVGVITLATDFNIERDLKQFYPADVESFTARVRNYNPLTMDNLRKMEPGISACADAILPGTDLDVIIYACTSGTIAIGSDRITQLVHETKPGVPVTNPVTSALAAFKRFNAKRISILTPYTESVNKEVAAFFVSQGIEVLNIAGFGFEDDTAMSFISPQDIQDAASQVCDPNADLMFISCTALRTGSVIENIEQEINKPVLTSNQVLAWHSLTLMSYAKPVDGYGVLLKKFLTNSPNSDVA